MVTSLLVVVRLNLTARLSHDASTLIGRHRRVDCQALTGSNLGAELGAGNTSEPAAECSAADDHRSPRWDQVL